VCATRYFFDTDLLARLRWATWRYSFKREMEPIDLRSDTVTKPTAEMRRAIAEAKVGDDVYAEDPTVNELEEKSADIFGKEAALFVPSGSMANQVALLAHASHGDSVIIGVGAHNYFYESGAGGALAGVQFTIVGDDGLFTVKDVDEAIAPPDHHFAPTKLVCVENTHNRSGGKIFPIADIEAISALCVFWNIRRHCDGARIFNAQVATGIDVKEWARHFDSISFCLSKGLGCPVGSVLLGDKEFRDRAHRYRKMLGGGMRQAGFLAAAGIYALDHHIDRLAEDHENAKSIANALLENPEFEVDPDTVETNIINVGIRDSSINSYQFVFVAKEFGVLINPRGKREFRLVTHLDFKAEMIPHAIELLGKALEESRP